MKVGVLQLNATIGDFSGNADKLITGYREACRQGARLVVAPELFLSGYPPRDLLFEPGFIDASMQALAGVAAAVMEVPLCVGCVLQRKDEVGKRLSNAAVFLQNGKIVHRVAKNLLPTYDVFDEARYFEPGTSTPLISFGGKKIALTICEDIWNDADFAHEHRYSKDPVRDSVSKGADLVINLSASPWHLGKQQIRMAMLERLARDEKVPIIHVNLVGGNDELIFDGHSLAFDRFGGLIGRGRSFAEDVYVWETDNVEPLPPVDWASAPERLIQGITLGLRDYVHKCGFKSVIIGLSGGIDSAVVAALAVRALGADNVRGVALPSRYSSAESLEDAKVLAKNLKIPLEVVSIEPAFTASLEALTTAFGKEPGPLTQENLQPRLRAQILTAFSNEYGALVLATSNKSELATGYCTLYGDTCGAVAPLGDVYKTDVYAVAQALNAQGAGIPERSLTKPPSAELRPEQTDQDTLPPYPLLDDILKGLIENQAAPSALTARGLPAKAVADVVRRLGGSEYKRRQCPPVLKTSSRSFGAGRQIPIAQAWRP